MNGFVLTGEHARMVPSTFLCPSSTFSSGSSSISSPVATPEEAVSAAAKAEREYQALRVATARGLPLRLVEDLVESHTERPLVGPAVVNVLALNMALAGLKR